MSNIYGTNTAVYTGCFTADYMMLMSKDPESMPKYTATGVAAAMLSNRISAFYNLHGPSMTIDTACSSSLVALDQACQSLRLGQSSMVRSSSKKLPTLTDLWTRESSLDAISYFLWT
jgi:acyl transferase domain-containing protein